MYSGIDCDILKYEDIGLSKKKKKKSGYCRWGNHTFCLLNVAKSTLPKPRGVEIEDSHYKTRGACCFERESRVK